MVSPKVGPNLVTWEQEAQLFKWENSISREEEISEKLIIMVNQFLFFPSWFFFELEYSVQSLSHVQLFVTPWTAVCQLPCPSHTPGACSNSCPSSWGCYPTISSRVQGTPKNLLQHHSSKASILQCSTFFIVQLTHPYMTTGKPTALTRQTFVIKVMSLLYNTLSRFVIAFFQEASIF